MNDIEKHIAEKGIDLASDFLKRLLKPSVDQIGELLGDRIKYWRFKNNVKVVQKAQEYVRQKGLKVHEVETKTLIKLLEFSSLEEDETMQDRWARLLAETATSKSGFSAHLTFVEILDQISPQEATVLENLFRALCADGFIQTGPTYTFSSEYAPKYNVGNTVDLHVHEADILFDNLDRLKLIEYDPTKSTFDRKEYIDKRRVTLTPLGIAFLEACSACEWLQETPTSTETTESTLR